MRFLFAIIFVFSVCTVQAKIDIKYTGYEIGNRYKLLQSFITDYEVENGGPILDNKVSIYKANKNKCVIVSRVDGDSGGYGSEDVLYFDGSTFLSGYSLNYSYIFLNEEGTKKSKKPNYMEIIDDNNNLKILKEDFIKYFKLFNKVTLSKC
ncbi:MULTISPECIES: hypothetical protein [Acinetobacter]|uniref:hypothetical protein n=1 Tax=Acinetobacter TaxID=469 RepID=UPI00190118E8|nr:MULTISPECIES: hypothetical protein [Acinetobacter]MBJ8551728.1 hypothetical protein [Acinetobacter bereziniae]MBJ9372575.1 hypothetical protein [Acinetobacter sp. TGL-Y2]